MYVALIVAGVLIHPIGFAALCCLLAGLAISELRKIAAPQSPTSLILFDTVGALVMVMGAWSCLAMPESRMTWKVWGLVFLLWYIARVIFQIYRRDGQPLRDLGVTFIGLLWIALPIALMSLVYGTGTGKVLVLSMFIMIWMNDTGAYLVGCTIGKHRLFERISPKKSWEGFFGGLVFAVLAGYVIGKVCSLNPLHMAGMGLVVSVFATYGDLLESLLKRSLGIKDSGNILPGHGGILDRIDSLLLVSPAVVLYFLCLTMC